MKTLYILASGSIGVSQEPNRNIKGEQVWDSLEECRKNMVIKSTHPSCNSIIYVIDCEKNDEKLIKRALSSHSEINMEQFQNVKLMRYGVDGFSRATNLNTTTTKIQTNHRSSAHDFGLFSKPHPAHRGIKLPESGSLNPQTNVSKAAVLQSKEALQRTERSARFLVSVINRKNYMQTEYDLTESHDYVVKLAMANPKAAMILLNEQKIVDFLTPTELIQITSHHCSVPIFYTAMKEDRLHENARIESIIDRAHKLGSSEYNQVMNIIKNSDTLTNILEIEKNQPNDDRESSLQF